MFHSIDAPADECAGLPKAHGSALVSGSSTGNSHVLVGAANVYDAGNSIKIIERVYSNNSLELIHVTHDEHKTVSLDVHAWFRQSIARQYDRENGWVNVQD